MWDGGWSFTSLIVTSVFDYELRNIFNALFHLFIQITSYFHLPTSYTQVQHLLKQTLIDGYINDGKTILVIVILKKFIQKISTKSN